MKKIIIIGGGIAGLSAGIHAQKYGFDSVIYEKHSILGGECTGWDRKGYHIDGCIHWLTGTKEGSDLNALWKEVGAFCQEDIIQLDSFGTYDCEGTEIVLWKDLERLRKDLIQLSPKDREAIEELIKDIKVVQSMEMPAKKPISMMNPLELMKLLKSMKGAGSVMNRLGKVSCGEYAKRFQHPALKTLFGRSLTAGYSVIAFIFSMATFSSGNGAIPKGGSRQMAFHMEKRYREMGGTVVRNVSAKEILVEGNRATAVQLSDGSEVSADYVVAACDAKITFEKLLKGRYNDEKFELRYQNQKDYPLPSSVQVSFGLTKDLSNYPVQINFPCTPYLVGTCENHWVSLRNYSYEKSFAPEGCTVVTSLLNQTDEDYFFWEKLYQDKEAYNKEKQRIAEDIQERMEKKYPELAGCITLLDVATPMTYKRYTGAYHGAWMSFMMTSNSKYMSHTGVIKGLKNCYLTGQWLEPPGGLPVAAVTGKFTIMRIAKKEKRLA